MRSRIKLKKYFQHSPKKYSKINPVPPRSTIKVREDNPGSFRSLLGQTFRVGYYSRQDGLNVIWIVDADGKYTQTMTHAFLNRHFRILFDSGDTDLHGDDRPDILPLSQEEMALS
jgi:hypothetical protein